MKAHFDPTLFTALQVTFLPGLLNAGSFQFRRQVVPGSEHVFPQAPSQWHCFGGVQSVFVVQVLGHELVLRCALSIAGFLFGQIIGSDGGTITADLIHFGVEGLSHFKLL